MKLSKRLRKWKANLTTQTPIDYVITLREDINCFADEVKALERENAKLREYVDRLERHALANVPTNEMKETKAWLNQMRRLCWLEERW